MADGTECVQCGAPADRHSPADNANGVAAGRHCYRCWLTEPADVRPARIQVERYAGRAVTGYLASVFG
jgi:hypothetical protein